MKKIFAIAFGILILNTPALVFANDTSIQPSAKSRFMRTNSSLLKSENLTDVLSKLKGERATLFLRSGRTSQVLQIEDVRGSLLICVNPDTGVTTFLAIDAIESVVVSPDLIKKNRNFIRHAAKEMRASP